MLLRKSLLIASLLIISPIYSMQKATVAKKQLSQEELNKCLYGIALRGDKETAAKLLAAGAHIDAQNEEFNKATPLHAAVTKGQYDFAEFLLTRGANPDLRDVHGLTPLHFAAYCGQEHIARLLLKHKAAVDARATEGLNKGNTPLFGAAEGGHVDIMKILIEEGKADVLACNEFGLNLFHCVAMNGQAEALAFLLTNVPDVAACINARDVQDFSPLLWAVAKGRTEVAKILIEHGADPEQAAKEGLTPLSCAIAQQNKPLEKFLKSVIKSKSGCSVCGKKKEECPDGLKKCGTCLVVYYCSAECQKHDWKEHRPICWKAVIIKLVK